MKKLVVGAVVLGLLLVAAGFLWLRAHPLRVHAYLMRGALQREGLKKASVNSGLGTQTYFKGGSGPAIILLHGAGDQAGAFAPVVRELLGSGHRLILPDLAGHGESAPSSGRIEVGMMLDALDTLLAAEIPRGEKVTLGGNSLGAWLSVLMAMRHPESVDRLVLINGGPLQHRAEGLTLLPASREEARTLMDALTDPRSPRVPGYVLDDVVRQARSGPLSRFAQSAEDMKNYVLDGKLGAAATPVEIVWGASDRLLPLSYAERMSREFPRARLTPLPACGHVPQQECPISLSKALIKLLKEPPPAPPSETGVSSVSPGTSLN